MQIDVGRIRLALAKTCEATSDFDLNTGLSRSVGARLNAAAVLIGLLERPTGAQLILTKRASHLQHHPGQIALPGGKADPSDVDAEATALREAYEEIGLPSAQVEVLGRLPSHETVTGFQIVPVLGRIRDDFPIVIEKGEVDEVFFVPLDHLLNLGNYQIQRRLWRGEWRNYYVVPFGPYYIWGATARILRSMAERLQT